MVAVVGVVVVVALAAVAVAVAVKVEVAKSDPKQSSGVAEQTSKP